MTAPFPLAFFAVGAGTAALGCLQLGWVSSAESGQIGLVLVSFVAPAQLGVAGRALARGSLVAGTGLALAGGGWLGLGLIELTAAPGSTSAALGAYVMALAVPLGATAFIASLERRWVPAVAAGTAIRFLATSVYEVSGSGGWETVAGILGLCLAVLALTAGLAMLVGREEERRQSPGSA